MGEGKQNKILRRAIVSDAIARKQPEGVLIEKFSEIGLCFLFLLGGFTLFSLLVTNHP